MPGGNAEEGRKGAEETKQTRKERNSGKKRGGRFPKAMRKKACFGDSATRVVEEKSCLRDARREVAKKRDRSARSAFADKEKSGWVECDGR